MTLLIPSESDLPLHSELYFIKICNPELSSELSCRTDCDVDVSKVTLNSVTTHNIGMSVLTRNSASCKFRCGTGD